MVRGEGNGHGGHAVLHDREQLDVRQMEVVSVTESLNKISLRILAREIKLTKLDNLKNVQYLVYRKTIVRIVNCVNCLVYNQFCFVYSLMKVE